MVSEVLTLKAKCFDLVEEVDKLRSEVQLLSTTLQNIVGVLGMPLNEEGQVDLKDVVSAVAELKKAAE